MNSMDTTGITGAGFGIVWLHVHWLFAALAVAGLVLLIIWATKEFSKEKLRSLVIWMLSIGIIGTLITASASVGLHGMNSKHCDGSMMKRMMKHSSESEGSEGMNNGDMKNMMN